MSKPRIIGELVIVAYKARHLPEREVIGKQDPFVVFRLGETTKKTKTDLRGGQHPTWDDQVTLPVPEMKKMVVVQVYDEDAKRQELISECELDFTKVLEDGEADDWYQLSYKGRPAGEIYLELTFYSAQPPPKRQPTRYGMSGRHPKPTGYAQPPPPSVPQQHRPYPSSPQYPPQPTNNVRPTAPIPVESHSTPTYHGSSPYPPHQQQQQRPAYNASPYPPPVPTPSISSGSQHVYPPQQQGRPNSRPTSYVGQTPNPNSRPTSPPVPGPGSYGSNNSASLLSSSYNPANASSGHRPSYGGYPPSNSNSGYPPSNSNSGYPPSGYTPVSNNPNRNSYPNYINSPYPPQQQFGGFPEPRQFSGGYAPHVDPLGTPFAAHQGSFAAPNTGGYPPNNNGGYPPHQSQGYPPNNGGYPPQQHGSGYPPF